MKQPDPAPGQFMSVGVTLAALMVAAFTAFRLSTFPQHQANVPEPDTALPTRTAPQPDASGAPANEKVKFPGVPGLKIQTFRTVSPSPWKPEMAMPLVSGENVHSFANAQDHYTADIDSRGITLRFWDAAALETSPLTLSLKNTPSSPGGKPHRVGDGRVEISRGDTLTEWYRNTPEGVEQGFTLSAPPRREQAGDGIRLELELPSTWTTVADAGSTSTRFREKGTGTEVRYQNLMAYDASGKRLSAWLEPLAGGGGVTLHASDAGAVYPVTIDPLFTVVTAARLGTAATLTTGDQDPVVLGDDLVFPLFQTSNGASLGLWRTPLTDRHDPVRVSDIQLSIKSDAYTGILQGVLNNRLHVSAVNGDSYTLAESGTGLVLLKEASGGGPFLAVEGSSAWYLRGQELWKTDGTPAGTVRVRTLAFYPQPYALMRAGKVYYTSGGAGGSLLHFSASDENFGTLMQTTPGLTLKKAVIHNNKILLYNNYSGLHATDGTIAGTKWLASVWMDDNNPAVLGIYYFFRSGNEFWRTDGSVEGTSRVTDSLTYSGHPVASNGNLYFSGRSRTSSLSNVYVSDGTETGIALFRANAYLAQGVGGDGLFYMMVTTEEEGEELWVSDGTEEGTKLLRDITPGPASTPLSSFRHAGRHLIFTAGTELWRTDGTPEGTMPLVDSSRANFDVTQISALTPAGGLVFFTATRPSAGAELWAADPTTGTATELEINPGTASSSPYQLKAFGEGGALFFATGVGTGTELWRSDGTVQGTVLVKDISPFPNTKPTELLVNGGTAWFIGPDSFGNIALGRTDGTSAGTVTVRTLPSWQRTPPFLMVPFGGGVAFLAAAENGTPGTARVWISDGTSAGTVSVAGAEVLAGSKPTLLADSGRLFLKGLVPSPVPYDVYGLWGFSGSPPVPRPLSSVTGVDLLLAHDGHAFYTAYDHPYGTRVFKTDGTPEGTTGLPFTIGAAGYPTRMYGAAGKVFFEEIFYTEPWSSTPTVVSSLFAINPDSPTDLTVNFTSANHNPPLSNPESLSNPGIKTHYNAVQVGNYEFFRAFGADLAELWISDGTNAGTLPIPEAGSRLSDLTSDGSRLFYLDNSPVLGTQVRMLSLTASLTVTASPPEGGTVTGGLAGATEPGLKPVTATPAAGYAFSHWEGAAVTEPNAPVTTVN
ncbi:MAG: hypothetical protein EOP86_13410, partial [Verrucomicrobiaceae bacterium]